MARKNIINSYHLVKGETISSEFVSEAVNIAYLDNAGLQVKTTGTLGGSLEVLASINGVDFESFDFGSTLTISANTSFLVNMQQLPYTQFKVKVNVTSGSSVVDVWTTVKEL